MITLRPSSTIENRHSTDAVTGPDVTSDERDDPVVITQISGLRPGLGRLTAGPVRSASSVVLPVSVTQVGCRPETG